MKRTNPGIIARTILIVLPLVAAAGPSSAAPVEPAGWYAGDMHVHRSCGGSPEAVSSLYTKMSTNNLAAISLLADMGNGEVQDPKTDLPLVNGQDDPSYSGRIVHWDTEWHWDATYSQYAHQALGGHIVALGLTGAQQLWYEYTYPVLNWARQQGGIAGFAHMQYLDNGIPQSLNCCIPIEYPVEVALGSADFISEDVNGSDTAIQAYYRLLNTGFRPSLAAGTDYPCGVSTLGSMLTYAKVANGQMTYRNWIEAIKAGRTVVSRNGHKEFLNLKVNNTAGPGDEISLSAAASLPASVVWTASQKYTGTIQLLRNGVVIASKQATVPANGSVTLSATAPADDKSSWLAARRTGNNGHVLHTSAVFVTVAGKPVRVSASDAQFYADWMDNLLTKTSPGGAWNGYFPTQLPEAQARYRAAKAIYQQRVTEAGGTPPPPGGGPTKIAGPQSIFVSQLPTLYENDAAYELGTTFFVDFPGKITAARLFTHSAEAGSHTVRIWRRSDGTLVGGPYTWNLSGSAGWKTLTLPTPGVAVAANTNYVVAISNGPDRYYAEQPNGLDATITNGNLHAVAGGGVWTNAIGTMPTQVWQNTNYFRDVVFVAD